MTIRQLIGVWIMLETGIVAIFGFTATDVHEFLEELIIPFIVSSGVAGMFSLALYLIS